MKRLLKMGFLLLLFGGIPGLVQAVPSAYVSRFGALSIKNTTSSTLLRDTQDPNTVWVLPPEGGQISFQNFSPSANLGFCQGLKSLIRATNGLAKRTEGLEDDVREVEEEVRNASQKVAYAREHLALQIRPSVTELEKLRDELETLQQKTEDLVAQWNKCTENCEDAKAAYQENKAEIKSLKERIAALSQENRNDLRAYMLAKQKFEAANEEFNEAGKRLEKKLVILNSLQDQILGMYGNRGKLEGGTAFASYDSGWDSNVMKLRAAYPHYEFKAIPTKGSRIFASIIGSSDKASYLESLPAILDYSINGYKFLPWTNTEIGDTEAALPSSIAGNFRLSLIGACPLADKDFFKEIEWQPKKTTQGQPLFGISATYQYAVGFAFKVRATFNLYRFYELIKREGTEGGFFSTKAYSRTVEKNVDRDTFHIDWKEEDPDSTFSSEVRMKVTNELKASLMERVLVTMGKPIFDGNASLPNMPLPPKSGAVILATGLNQCWSIYCKVGGFVLMGFDSIFGSSSAETNLEKSWNRTAVEEWNAETMHYRGGVTGFSRI